MRGAKRKGTRYFGPYAHAWAIRETLDLALRVFPVRTCSAGVFKRAGQVGRPCLLGYIDKCSAPCVGRVDAAAPPRDRRGLLRLHGGRDRAVRQPPHRGDEGGRRRARLRAGRPAARRHRGARAGAREVGRRAPRRHRRRRVRPGRGRARGGGAALPRARRPGARPARLGGRARRRDHPRGRRAPAPAGLRQRGRRRRAARGARAGAARRRRGALAVAVGACAAAGSTCGCRGAATSAP